MGWPSRSGYFLVLIRSRMWIWIYDCFSTVINITQIRLSTMYFDSTGGAAALLSKYAAAVWHNGITFAEFELSEQIWFICAFENVSCSEYEVLGSVVSRNVTFVNRQVSREAMWLLRSLRHRRAGYCNVHLSVSVFLSTGAWWWWPFQFDWRRHSWEE